jgi:IclR family pca regulon transcriptional regulator
LPPRATATAPAGTSAPAGTTTPAITRADLIEGMAKGMAVLESFDTERQRLNATLAAQRAGLSRAAARRHLLTLAHLGYLETDGSLYWLSPRVLRFSGSYLSTARLPRLLQPVLQRLAQQHQAAFSAVVLDADEVVIVATGGQHHDPARSPGTRLLAYGTHLGARLPAFAASTGRVLMAEWDRATLGAWLKGRTLPRLTAHTRTTHAALRAELDAVRREGFCLAVEEHELGVHALAVPLRDAQGRALAALNTILPGGCADPAPVLRRWLPVLQQAAGELRPVL